MPDAIDRAIINMLQDGFPIAARPFRLAGAALGLDEQALIERLGDLIAGGQLSRFGPMYNAERMGGAFCLAAMAVPADRFEEVAQLVNAHIEVAHNYQRAHALNMWFVIGTEQPEDIDAVLTKIKSETGLEVYAFPKLEEFYIGLKVSV